MTAAYSLQALTSAVLFAAAGMTFRILIDPRRSLVVAARRVLAWLDSRAASRVAQAVAAIALVLSVGVGVREYALTQCQARYAESSNTSQRARAQAADLDRRAQDQLFQAIADHPDQAIDSLRAYNVSRAEADAQRARNPVPPAPSTSCG
jgi:hypothetical protein